MVKHLSSGSCLARIAGIAIVGVIMLAGAPPAAAVDADRPVANRLITPAGVEVTGVTVVDEKDALRVKREQVAASRGQEPAAQGAAAAANDLKCLSGWRLIGGGPANSNWRPHMNQGGLVYPNGNAGVDPWNQHFLPCWLSGWDVHAWAFLSNATGKLVDYGNLGGYSASLSADAGGTLLATYTRFFVCDLDGYWMYLREAGYPDSYTYAHSRDTSLTRNFGPLNGKYLFRIDPPVSSGNC